MSEIGATFIILVKPYLFTDGILNPTYRCLEKARRKNSRVKELNLDELNYNKVTCIRHQKIKLVRKTLFTCKGK